MLHRDGLLGSLRRTPATQPGPCCGLAASEGWRKLAQNLPAENSCDASGAAMLWIGCIQGLEKARAETLVGGVGLTTALLQAVSRLSAPLLSQMLRMSKQEHVESTPSGASALP